MATPEFKNTNNSTSNRFWSEWWPYILVLGFLILFPFIAGLTMGDPQATQEGAGFLENLMLKTESGYAKFWQGMLIQMFILGIFAMSYDLLLGYTGVLSFGHAMFFGTGGYVLAILIGRNFDWPLGWSLVAVTIDIIDSG